MALRGVVYAVVLVFSPGPPGASAADAPHRTPVLDALLRSFANVRTYSVTIAAHEVDGAKTDDRVLRFSMRRPDRATLQVLEGRGAGTRLLWAAGKTVRVRGGIFSWVPISLGINDARVTSLRGNTILQADFGATLGCFALHRDNVTESPGPAVAGAATSQITLRRSRGMRCDGDPPKDVEVTRDVLTVRANGSMLRRERYAGERLVERWTLSGIVLNPGLGDDDFR